MSDVQSREVVLEENEHLWGYIRDLEMELDQLKLKYHKRGQELEAYKSSCTTVITGQINDLIIQLEELRNSYDSCVPVR